MQYPFIGCLAPVLLLGCSPMSAADQTPFANASVTGTVTYLQRVALPANAVLTVRLVDVSRADAPAVMLGEQIIVTGGKQVPFAFEIAYDPSKVDERSSYALQARIENDGTLSFVSDRSYAVITRGAPSRVDMVLRAVSGREP